MTKYDLEHLHARLRSPGYPRRVATVISPRSPKCPLVSLARRTKPASLLPSQQLGADSSPTPVPVQTIIPRHLRHVEKGWFPYPSRSSPLARQVTQSD